MAKGGKKRTYVRDGNGRFASTPGSAAKKAAKSTSGRKGTLGARTGLKGSKAKLKAKDKADQTLQNTLSTRAQKGAVKRGSRKLAAAKVAAQTRIGGGRKGVIGRSKGLKARPALKPSLLAGAATTLQQSLSKAKTKSDEAKARIAYKRIVRQELKNNPQNVLASNVPKQKRLPDQDSRMSKSKVRTVGNSKERVQKRTTRKLYQAERALDRTLNMKNRGLLVQASTYEKQLRSALTLGSASKYLKTGQLPRGNNSIAEKRKMADMMERLTQKNKQRARGRAARESRMSGAVKPAKPTRTKGSRTTLPRTPGTIAKPKAKDRNEGSAKPKAMTESGPTSGKMYRTRKQSAAKQISKKKKLLTSVPFEVTTNDRFGTKTSVYRSPGKLKKNTLKIKTATSSQLNLLGGVDRITTKAVSSGLREALPVKSTKNNNTNISVGAPGSREIADFVSSKTPMAKSKAKLALRRLVSSDGTVTTREELIRKKINEGWSVKADSRDGHHLYNKNTSSFLTQKDITLTGIEYAKHLLSKKSNK